MTDTDSDSESSYCTVCGTDVRTDEWHPAAVEELPGGEIRLHTFCSEQCRTEWESTESETASADA